MTKSILNIKTSFEAYKEIYLYTNTIIITVKINNTVFFSTGLQSAMVVVPVFFPN